jgi:uncharacterized membrane protein YfcA
VFTPGGLLAGALAAFLVGLSKTGLPGAGVVAVPLVALVVEGRMIPGASLPIRIVADFIAIAWYSRYARWDVLRGVGPWIGAGFVVGTAFFVWVGTATRLLETLMGAVLLVIVLLELWRVYRETTARLGPVGRAFYGSAGGFTTFVANAAGPVLNTLLASLRLPKMELLGTAAVLYFVANLAKVPFYLALGAWSEGGSFFTWEAIAWNAVLVPAVVAGVYAGRSLVNRMSQRIFLIAILLFSALGALFLML